MGTIWMAMLPGGEQEIKVTFISTWSEPNAMLTLSGSLFNPNSGLVGRISTPLTGEELEIQSGEVIFPRPPGC